MNALHRLVCRSSFWRKKLACDIIPWVLDGVSLGEDALEIGPGPGLSTEILHTHVTRLTAIEVDRECSQRLNARFRGTNVAVVIQDATETPMPDESFSSAICMNVLHHMPSAGLQNRLFAEMARLLCPGGMFLGCDRLFRSRFDVTHLFDTKYPVPPSSLDGRLWWAGFEKVEIEIREHDFRFRARKPSLSPRSQP